MKLNKPDNVVYNEDLASYDASLKSYGTNVGAPVISAPDVVSWKNRNLNKVNAQFKSKYEELKIVLDEFRSNFQVNQRVYNAKINFEPVVGNMYYLYKNKENEDFLSILSPQECNFNYVASFVLNSDNVWLKTEG
jgi:hypothetical protein